MINLSLDEIISAVNGNIVIEGKDNKYNKISTDTRKIKEGNLFIALCGENFNGNKFANEAIKRGATICIVSDDSFLDKTEIKSYVIKVNDTKEALLNLAEAYRSKFKGKVISITGSTGKTSTKDLVAAGLSSRHKVYKTKGNFNNEIGLPLSIFELDEDVDVAVLEMGMSNFNEIHNMAKAAKPDIAVITNIGISHIENLGSREGILKAKMEITDFFTKENTLILNGEDDLLKTICDKEFDVVKVNLKNDEPFKVYDICLLEEKVIFTIEDKKEKYTYEIDTPGMHTVSNALLAITCGKKLGLNFKEINEGFKKLEKTSMRMDIIRGKKAIIVNDCYNASPDSMKAAIDVLKNISCNRRIAVLGTMRELGDESFNAHKLVGKYAKDNNVDMLISVGEFKDAFKEGSEGIEVKCFDTKEEAFKYLQQNLNEGDCILVKASRAMEMEKLVEKLKNIVC